MARRSRSNEAGSGLAPGTADSIAAYIEQAASDTAFGSSSATSRTIRTFTCLAITGSLPGCCRVPRKCRFGPQRDTGEMKGQWSASPRDVRLAISLPLVALLLAFVWPPSGFDAVSAVLFAVVALLAVGVLARRSWPWRFMVLGVLLWIVGDVWAIADGKAGFGSVALLLDAAALWFLTRTATRHWVDHREATTAATTRG